MSDIHAVGLQSIQKLPPKDVVTHTGDHLGLCAGPSRRHRLVASLAAWIQNQVGAVHRLSGLRQAQTLNGQIHVQTAEGHDFTHAIISLLIFSNSFRRNALLKRFITLIVATKIGKVKLAFLTGFEGRT